MKTSKDKLNIKIIQKAWSDESFKQRLLENPVKSIEEEFGVKLELPADKELVVVDQSSEKRIHIYIPPMHGEMDVELSEDQLEAAAGGGIPIIDIGGGTTGPYNPFEDIILTTI